MLSSPKASPSVWTGGLFFSGWRRKSKRPTKQRVRFPGKSRESSVLSCVVVWSLGGGGARNLMPCFAPAVVGRMSRWRREIAVGGEGRKLYLHWRAQ